MVLRFVESESLNTEFVIQDGWASIYIQEANDLAGILERTKGFKSFSGSVDVALCRLYEVYISQGFQFSIFDYIASVYKKNEIAKFFDDRAEGGVKSFSSVIFDDFWSRLWNPDIYRSKSAWEDFTNDTDNLVRKSESLLNSYCDWWILGKDKEESDPMQRMEETGVMDPIDDTPASEWQTFYGIFPALYFAFSVLRKYQRKSDFIKFIALKCPRHTPDFPGYDLWLQRQAFLVCLQEYGIPFIRENLKDIRLELIAYAVLKVEMTEEERESLKDLLSHQEYEYCVIALEPEHVKQLIIDVQAQGSLTRGQAQLS